MPKFDVKLTRMVEETCTATVEADNANDAIQKAFERSEGDENDFGSPSWGWDRTNVPIAPGVETKTQVFEHRLIEIAS